MSSVKLENINKSYTKDVPIIRNLNLNISSGEFAVIVGPSGCGKSTLLRLIAGLEEVTDGEILSNSNVRVIRDGSVIFTGKISSIFREKNQVKQVGNGQECGITLKDYMDFQKNDTIEAFNVTSTERSI